MAGVLPIQAFDTSSFDPEEQFAAWRDVLSPILDSWPTGRDFPPSFFGQFTTYIAGPLILGGTAFESHRYGRDAARVRRDGLNHYQVTLHRKGGFAGRFGEHDIYVAEGDITVMDFAQPMIIETEPSEILAIAVPRDAIDLKIEYGRPHGIVLRSTSKLGALLSDHIHSFIARLPGMTLQEAAVAASGSVAMMAACFQPSAATFGYAGSEIFEALGNKIRQYIALNLRENSVSAAEICEVHNISRATLYRMFEPFGGVATYTQNQRLSRVFTALLNPLLSHRKISEIAYEWGFASESHFSRAFRKAFSMSPSEARASVRPVPSGAAALQDWTPRLRRV